MHFFLHPNDQFSSHRISVPSSHLFFSKFPASDRSTPVSAHITCKRVYGYTRWCEKLDFHFIQFFFFLFLQSSNSHWRCCISLGRGNAAHNSRKTLMRGQQPVDIACRAAQQSASHRAKVSTAAHQLWMEIGAENEKRRVF